MVTAILEMTVILFIIDDDDDDDHDHHDHDDGKSAVALPIEG